MKNKTKIINDFVLLKKQAEKIQIKIDSLNFKMTEYLTNSVMDRDESQIKKFRNANVLCEYQPLQGFYDLRNWDIPKKDFLKLWGIQKYLFQCEKNRQKGLYKNMPNELEKVKNLSAEYQQTLFSYTNVGGFA